MNLLQPHPDFFQLGSFTITAHGFFFALGAVIATLFLVSQRRSFELRAAEVVERSLVIFLLGILGARLGYLLTYPSQWENTWDVLAIWQGGLITFAGILVGFLVASLYARSWKTSRRQHWYDAIVLAALLGWAVGRLGNYYAAESGGVASQFWYLTYDHVPIQLFESLGCLLLFVLLRFFRLSPGQTAFVGIAGYAVLRFCVDFWRDELVVGLRLSQWVALVLLIGVALLYVFRRRSS